MSEAATPPPQVELPRIRHVIILLYILVQSLLLALIFETSSSLHRSSREVWTGGILCIVGLLSALGLGAGSRALPIVWLALSIPFLGISFGARRHEELFFMA